MTRPITPQDLWNIPRVEGPCASADGHTVVVPVTHFDVEQNRGRTVLYLLENGVPRPLTDPQLSATSPAVDAGGNSVAFLRKDSEGHDQVHVLSLDGGEARRVTDLPLGASGVRWLPDGRLIIVVQLVTAAPTVEGTRRWRDEERNTQIRTTERRVYRFWDTWLTDGETWHPFVLDPVTEELRDLTPDRHWWWRLSSQGDPAAAYDISPDGSEITFSALELDESDELPIWRLYTVPVAGGDTVCRTPALPADATWPRYLPDGRLAYLFQREPDFYADRRRLAVIEQGNETHTVLTEEWDASISTFEPSGEDGFLLVSEQQGRMALFRADSSGDTPELVSADGSFSNILATSDGSIYARHERLQRPPEIVRVVDGSIERLTDFTSAALSDIDLGTVEETSVVGANGTDIQVFLVFPPGHDRSRPLPLVHMIHGGPHGTFGDSWHFRWNAQTFAAPGYLVALVNFHGSTSFGDAFTRSIHGRWGDQPSTDIMAVTDALIERGLADPERMAVTGGSYGGYLTAWLVSQTDRFSCAIAHAAVTNMGGMYATDMTYGFSRSRGAEVWEDPAQVERWSPSAHAAGYNTPTLVIHGERDYRVPVGQGLEFYGVLKAKGVPARLVYFPEENHWILKPQNSLVWYREIHDWLARWLAE